VISTSVVDLQELLADDPTFEEQDEPLATQHHRDVIDSLYYSLRDRLAGPSVSVAAESRLHAAELEVARLRRALQRPSERDDAG